MSEIETCAWDYTRQAFRNRLMLPLDDDAYELLIHPDGSWDLVTLDLSHARAPDAKPNAVEFIALSNHAVTNKFLQHLTELRHLLPGQAVA